MINCTKCNLYKTSKAGNLTCVKLMGAGNQKADIMLVGEAPGANEIVEKKPFVGKAGTLLRRNLKVVGIDTNEIYITNIIKCRPPMNRTPTDIEVKTCSGYLEEEIRKVKPKVIGLLGNTPLKYFLGISGITKVRGNKVWDEKYNCWLLPLYHPSYLLRFSKKAKQHNEFVQDLGQLISLTNKKRVSRETRFKVIDSLAKVKKAVDILLTQEWVVFDLETTGLKPIK